MKIFAASLILAFTGVAGAFAASTTEASGPIPRKAPEFVIHMPNGKELLLSQYRGKVVALAFMHTTCPHCQALAPMLGAIQRDYAAKGVEILGAVFNPPGPGSPGAKATVDMFVSMYSRNAIPVGWSDERPVLDFLKHPDPHYYVPIMVFIDRQGMIQAQYIGDNDFFRDQDKNIRAELDKLLAAPAAGAKKKTVISKKK